MLSEKIEIDVVNLPVINTTKHITTMPTLHSSNSLLAASIIARRKKLNNCKESIQHAKTCVCCRKFG